MIQTTINYSDPVGGIEAPAEVVAAMEEASRMLEEAVDDSDPLRFNAQWQFQQNDQLGPHVALRLACNDEVAQVTFAINEFKDLKRLRDKMGWQLIDLAARVSRVVSRRLFKSIEEWQNAATVEG